jgi:EAL domain-containing protein (putative c-di-GMP-specific phosphodiesterase class I)
MRLIQGLRLHTALQPVISLAHGKPVGHEALLRAVDGAGVALPPRQALGVLEERLGAASVEAECRDLHVGTFSSMQLPGWLFLNVSPHVVAEPRSVAAAYASFLAEASLPAHRIVVEILETSAYDECRLAEAVACFRDLGCLVAIDDFGAGHSNFERIWRIRPDIVKLDRSMVEQASENPLVRRILPGLVSLLHEAECLVVLEGIETEEQALVAMESDADFVQGYYFAEPSVKSPDFSLLRARLDALGEKFRGMVAQKTDQDRGSIDAYSSAFLACAETLRKGKSLGNACAEFLQMRGVERAYLLDQDGVQIGINVESGHLQQTADRRFDPCADGTGANWFRRPYFRRAIRAPHTVQVSRPYLSIRDAKTCVTLSIAVVDDASCRVLCADLDLAAAAALSDDLVLRDSGHARCAPRVA